MEGAHPSFFYITNINFLDKKDSSDFLQISFKDVKV